MDKVKSYLEKLFQRELNNNEIAVLHEAYQQGKQDQFYSMIAKEAFNNSNKL